MAAGNGFPIRMLIFSGLLLLSMPACGESSAESSQSGTEADSSTESIADGLPRLVDLGSTNCVPCVMMESELAILDSLTGDRLSVEFVNIYEDEATASEFGIRLIPTQVFIAEDGTELYRHEGFFSAPDMLAKWIALGYDLNEAAER
jgi:thioredoxin 1